jgi:outer membrane protein OmpA-like peptidoglycan-associated protein
MNRLFRPTIVAALGVAASASVASANVEIGGTAGIHVFSTDNELGVPDVEDAPSERNSALFGLRLGVTFNDMLGVEGEFGVIPSESRTLVFDIWNVTYRAHLIAQFGAANPTRKLVPFVLFGGGATQIVDSKNEDFIEKDTDAALYAGIGAKYRVDNGWGLRADARLLFPPSSTGNGPTVDFEALLSIYKEFGRAEVEKVVEPAAPGDTDGDGLVDDVDKCPNEAEDKDGFQDDDGCPDADNDGDGVADANDKCPMEPEDKDGFQDDDGCAEADNDSDGLADASDKCPNEPEDKDGFQDDDGCPDPDNDGDGVADGQDKCVDQPETRNGYQDEDGCPDEIPQKVKQFTGVIQGINFKTNSADLLPASNKTLDKAVAVLKEFGDLKLEIQGHTDDQPIKKGGKFADNKSLSQARAETVKAYFVGKGIEEGRLTASGLGDEQPIVPPAGLKGGKLNAARAKNRRVEFKLVSSMPEAPAAPAPAPAPAPAAPEKKESLQPPP